MNIRPKTRNVQIESTSRHVQTEDRPQRAALDLTVFGQFLTKVLRERGVYMCT
jgi:hypothetical protein